jgi:hypothetical protein
MGQRTHLQLVYFGKGGSWIEGVWLGSFKDRTGREFHVCEDGVGGRWQSEHVRDDPPPRYIKYTPDVPRVRTVPDFVVEGKGGLEQGS